MICNCIDWKFNIDKVNAPFILAAARNPGRINYDGKQFRYCPWCSKPLRDEGSETKSVAAPSESLIPKKEEVVPHDCLQEKERTIAELILTGIRRQDSVIDWPTIDPSVNRLLELPLTKDEFNRLIQLCRNFAGVVHPDTHKRLKQAEGAMKRAIATLVHHRSASARAAKSELDDYFYAAMSDTDKRE